MRDRTEQAKTLCNALIKTLKHSGAEPKSPAIIEALVRVLSMAIVSKYTGEPNSEH